MSETRWWRRASTASEQFLTWDNERLAAVLEQLLSGQDVSVPWSVSAQRIEVEMAYIMALGRFERRQALIGLWRRHGPETLSGDECTGVTASLWARLLAQLAPESRARLLTPESTPGLRAVEPQQGVKESRDSSGRAPEPWIEHAGQLWAWGRVRVPATREGAPLDQVSPRLLWRPSGREWWVHPAIRRAVERTSPPAGSARASAPPLPQLHSGPGFFMACAMDAMAEVLQWEKRMTGQQRAMFYGTVLLPTIGPTRALSDISPVAREQGDEEAVDRAGRHVGGIAWQSGGMAENLSQPVFHLLHRQVQATVWVIQGVCARLLAGDSASIQAMLAMLRRGGGGAGDVAGTLECTRTLLADVVERALLRLAAERAEDGFGFRLLGRHLQEALAVQSAPSQSIGASGMEMSGDAATAKVGAGACGFVARVRRAIDTALGVAAEATSQVTRGRQQLEDLIWLRWCDADFLA